MSEFTHKPGTFILFKNNKDGVETRPDYKGEGAAMNGEPIEVAAWIKQGAKGKFMSCRYKPKGEKPEPKPAPKVGNSFDDMADDIPF